MNLIQGSLQAVLPPKRKTTSGGWISFNAPCCIHRGESQDKRQRGGLLFDAEGFVYSCFNCGFKAGWKPGKTLSKNTKTLMRWMGIPDTEINRLVLETLKEKDSETVDKKPISFELHDEPLPEDCLSIREWLEAGCTDSELLAVIEYIESRGFTLDDYSWHWSAAAGYKDRLIIPCYYKGRIVGWTGRKITSGRPKYLSKTQNGYVFNIDRQLFNRQYVIIVEGHFDAIAIDGMAIMTNEPNDIQCARINALAKEVIVVPDRDRPGARLLQAAINNGWGMSLPPWEEDIKDVADAVQRYGKIYTLATILHYKETNKIKIELQKKKLEKINVE